MRSPIRYALIALFVCVSSLLLPSLIRSQSRSAAPRKQADAKHTVDKDQTDSSRPLSLQSTRPDILWMRGGHTTEVWDVSSAPQAGIFATLGIDETVKIWRLSDYSVIRTIPAELPSSSCPTAQSFRLAGITSLSTIIPPADTA